MSDLFRSALGYLSGPSAGGTQGSQGVSGYSTTSGGPSDESNALGEIISFSHNATNRSVRINKLIAEGGFSYVFRAQDTKSGDNVAVKKILAPDDDARKGVAQEIQYMRQFQHEHIIKYFGNFVKKPVGGGGKGLEEYYLGMEFCPVQLPTPPLRLQHTAQVFAQTMKAIKYLHEFGIIHRDIKLENILVGVDGLVKLVDFGSATMEKIYPAPEWSMAKRTLVEEQIAAKTTPMYRAPEMLDLWSNYPIDERVDMWALGCLLFALSFGQHPFQDSNKLAIVNANYSLPKNTSPSSPVATIIRGLLKVDPNERLSHGQVQEVLVSIAESQSFSLFAPLPWKPTPSPSIAAAVQSVGGGIVNPLASVAAPVAGNGGSGGGGSLFSSLKGGAASLIKNIKEQSQQYLNAPPTNPNANTPSSAPHVPPPRPVPPSSSTSHPHQGVGGEREHRGPPPRPMPPSPLTTRKDKNHIEFENREYEAMQNHHQQQHIDQQRIPPRPAPPKPPPPQPHVPPQPKVANLLDMSFDSPTPSLQREERIEMNPNIDPFATTSGSASNADLLGDLFGGSATSNLSNDFLWGNNTPAAPAPTVSVNGGIKNQSEDLLGDPLASLLAKSLPSSRPAAPPSSGSSQPFFQAQGPHPGASIPSSASFGNLNGGFGISNAGTIGAMIPPSPNLLDTGGSKLPKNSSSPNLLVDSILDDIMGIGLSAPGGTAPSINKSNPALNVQIGNNNTSTRPNYNRTDIFDPPAPEAKSNLNDVFGEILNSQGFSTNKGDQGRTINDMRKIEMLANPNANPTQIKVNEWREGKKKNIRALLASLHTITWSSCHWEETNMSQMVTPPQVKKVYRKACLAIHPDKQMGTEWEELAKMIFVELNEAWAAFEESQQ